MPYNQRYGHRWNYSNQRQGKWYCPRCNFDNYPERKECYKCRYFPLNSHGQRFNRYGQSALIRVDLSRPPPPPPPQRPWNHQQNELRAGSNRFDVGASHRVKSDDSKNQNSSSDQEKAKKVGCIQERRITSENDKLQITINQREEKTENNKAKEDLRSVLNREKSDLREHLDTSSSTAKSSSRLLSKSPTRKDRHSSGDSSGGHGRRNSGDKRDGEEGSRRSQGGRRSGSLGDGRGKKGIGGSPAKSRSCRTSGGTDRSCDDRKEKDRIVEGESFFRTANLSSKMPYNFDKTALPPPPLPPKKPTCDTIPSDSNVSNSGDKSDLTVGSRDGGDTDNVVEMPCNFDKTVLPPQTVPAIPSDTHVSNSDDKRSELHRGSIQGDDTRNVANDSALVETGTRHGKERVDDEVANIQIETGSIVSDEDLAFHERQAMKDKGLNPHLLSPHKPLETEDLNVDKAEIPCESSVDDDTSTSSSVRHIESDTEEEVPVMKNLDQLKNMIEDFEKVSAQVKKHIYYKRADYGPFYKKKQKLKSDISNLFSVKKSKSMTYLQATIRRDNTDESEIPEMFGNFGTIRNFALFDRQVLIDFVVLNKHLPSFESPDYTVICTNLEEKRREQTMASIPQHGPKDPAKSEDAIRNIQMITGINLKSVLSQKTGENSAVSIGSDPLIENTLKDDVRSKEDDGDQLELSLISSEDLAINASGCGTQLDNFEKNSFHTKIDSDKSSNVNSPKVKDKVSALPSTQKIGHLPQENTNPTMSEAASQCSQHQDNIRNSFHNQSNQRFNDGNMGDGHQSRFIRNDHQNNAQYQREEGTLDYDSHQKDDNYPRGQNSSSHNHSSHADESHEDTFGERSESSGVLDLNATGSSRKKVEGAQSVVGEERKYPGWENVWKKQISHHNESQMHNKVQNNTISLSSAESVPGQSSTSAQQDKDHDTLISKSRSEDHQSHHYQRRSEPRKNKTESHRSQYGQQTHPSNKEGLPKLMEDGNIDLKEIVKATMTPESFKRREEENTSRVACRDFDARRKKTCYGCGVEVKFDKCLRCSISPRQRTPDSESVPRHLRIKKEAVDDMKANDVNMGYKHQDSYHQGNEYQKDGYYNHGERFKREHYPNYQEMHRSRGSDDYYRHEEFSSRSSRRYSGDMSYDSQRRSASDHGKKSAYDNGRKSANEYERKPEYYHERKSANEYERKSANDYERRSTDNQGRKSASDHNRKSANDHVRKSASDHDRKSASNHDRKSSNIHDRKSAKDDNPKSISQADEDPSTKSYKQVPKPVDKQTAKVRSSLLALAGGYCTSGDTVASDAITPSIAHSTPGTSGTNTPRQQLPPPPFAPATAVVPPSTTSPRSSTGATGHQSSRASSFTSRDESSDEEITIISCNTSPLRKGKRKYDSFSGGGKSDDTSSQSTDISANRKKRAREIRSQMLEEQRRGEEGAGDAGIQDDPYVMDLASLTRTETQKQLKTARGRKRQILLENLTDEDTITQPSKRRSTSSKSSSVSSKKDTNVGGKKKTVDEPTRVVYDISDSDDELGLYSPCGSDDIQYLQEVENRCEPGDEEIRKEIDSMDVENMTAKKIKEFLNEATGRRRDIFLDKLGIFETTPSKSTPKSSQEKDTPGGEVTRQSIAVSCSGKAGLPETSSAKESSGRKASQSDPLNKSSASPTVHTEALSFSTTQGQSHKSSNNQSAASESIVVCLSESDEDDHDKDDHHEKDDKNGGKDDNHHEKDGKNGDKDNHDDDKADHHDDDKDDFDSDDDDEAGLYSPCDTDEVQVILT